MKKIKNQIQNLKDTISKIENDEYKSVFQDIANILNDLSSKVEDVMVNEAVLAENFKYMDDDISNLQEELFEEVSIDDLDMMEEQYKEIQCKNCGKTIFIEEAALQENKEIPCPYCNKNII
ncbi:MAG: hypothetical protein E7213_02985 [Clostridium sp.]|jgi:DNA-directed RNA polymerase subunit RPC12/RpoP|nr:hypothetical protein [Clostridium sp.]